MKSFKPSLRKSLSLFVICAFFSSPLLAQPSPNAMALGQYANMHPLNFYTGQSVTSIPIASVSAKGLSVPIALSYNTTGMEFQEKSGQIWLGH